MNHTISRRGRLFAMTALALSSTLLLSSCGESEPEKSPRDEVVEKTTDLAYRFVGMWNQTSQDPYTSDTAITTVASGEMVDVIRNQMRTAIDSGIRAVGDMSIVDIRVGDIMYPNSGYKGSATTLILCVHNGDQHYLNSSGQTVPKMENVLDYSQMVLMVQNPAYPDFDDWRVTGLQGSAYTPCDYYESVSS